MAQDRRDLPGFTAIQSNVPFPVTVRIEAGGSGSALLSASQVYADELPRVQTDIHNNVLVISYNGHFSSSSASGMSFAGGSAFASAGSSFSSVSSSGGESVRVINGVVYRNGQRVDSGEGAASGATLTGNMPDIRIVVTSQRINSLSLNGVGSLSNEAASRLEEADLQVQLTGTGQLRLTNIQADNVRASLSGTGQMKLAGQAGSLSANLSGTGQLDAVEMPVQQADVRVSGTGQAKVSVAQRLSGAIEGVGAIGYKGDPQIDVQKSITGRLCRIP